MGDIRCNLTDAIGISFDQKKLGYVSRNVFPDEINNAIRLYKWEDSTGRPIASFSEKQKNYLFS